MFHDNEHRDYAGDEANDPNNVDHTADLFADTVGGHACHDIIYRYKKSQSERQHYLQPETRDGGNACPQPGISLGALGGFVNLIRDDKNRDERYYSDHAKTPRPERRPNLNLQYFRMLQQAKRGLTVELL